ncbi:unnamed protein product [Onchocerca flexuosa]|uniref:ATP-dependent DNA helicase n=1 Tax=Onchocerca flexuosa TaxID=387005 RepID=A0A183I627_9BILA|nr:unnamed protein product [Onchocerca flexuosa]
MSSPNRSAALSLDVKLCREQNYNTTDLLSYVKLNYPKLMFEQKAFAIKLCKLSASNMGKVLQKCKLFVWDECTTEHKKSVEARGRSLQDLCGNTRPFGNILILLGRELISELCGLNLKTDCFSHGKLYVACSRVSKPDNLYICIDNGTTKNIVYSQDL